MLRRAISVSDYGIPLSRLLWYRKEEGALHKLTGEEFGRLVQGPLFQGLGKAVLHEIAPLLDVEQWSSRQVVMAPQSTCKRFYVLLQGRVKITRQNLETGRELTLFLLGPGDGFNIVSLLDGKRHEVVAVTLDPVIAVSAPIATWHDWLDLYPSLRNAMRHYIDQQMRQLSELATDLALHDTMARLAHLILRNYEESRVDPRRDLLHGLSHEELAHLIGTVRVVVNRLLKELREEGVIECQGGEMHVLNLQKLLHRAERELDQNRSPNLL